MSYFWCDKHAKVHVKGHDSPECLLVGPFSTEDQAAAFPLGDRFDCKLDMSHCDHDWNNEGINPTHCLKCGQSFIAYAFMEAP